MCKNDPVINENNIFAFIFFRVQLACSIILDFYLLKLPGTWPGTDVGTFIVFFIFILPLRLRKPRYTALKIVETRDLSKAQIYVLTVM